MIRPGTYDIRALRHQKLTLDFVIRGFNLEASVFKLQVRPALDSAALDIDLVTVVAPAQGISAVHAVVDGLSQTTVSIRVDKATLVGLTEPVPAGERDLVRFYDLKIDDVVWVRGQFIVESSVTV
jgi:hypothetical protein